MGYSGYPTFNEVQERPPTATSTFHVVLFTAPSVVGGFDLRAGDVAFSYAALHHMETDRTLSVGLADDSTPAFTPLPRIAGTRALPPSAAALALPLLLAAAALGAQAPALFVTDLAEHYAQVASYMRLMGMVPPSAQARPRS